MTIKQFLQGKGYRLTKQREELLQILTSYDKPFSVQNIYESLTKKHVSIDLASIYRSFELFVNMGILHVIDLGNDRKQYEVADPKNHHHHLVCNSCGVVEDITFNEDTLLKEVNNKTKFKIDHHHLEFFGTCPDCQ